MNNKMTKEEQAAFDKGYMGYYSGRHQDCHPYGTNHKLGYAWIKGWLQAQSEDDRADEWDMNEEYGD